MERRTIQVILPCGLPCFEAVIRVPEDRDDEEYIDELLDTVLDPKIRYETDWDFVDGLC